MNSTLRMVILKHSMAPGYELRLNEKNPAGRPAFHKDAEEVEVEVKDSVIRGPRKI